MAALSPAFDVAVLSLAAAANPAGWTVADDAPSTLADVEATYFRNGRLTVWSGASDSTIYGSPSVNHAARAWHDMGHLLLHAPFSPYGERQVHRWQHRQLAAAYSKHPLFRLFAVLLKAEVIGQVDHESLHGSFPADQRTFALGWVGARGLSHLLQ